MYNENENNYNTLNENKQDTTYSYTRDQLENQWQPNTGTYFNDSSEDRNAAKAAKKARKAQKKAAKRADRKSVV